MRSIASFLSVIAFAVALLADFSGAAAALPQSSADAITGLWYTEGHEGGVELYACEDQICGRFVWVKPSPEGVAHDEHNPDVTKRQRVLCHLQFMGNFKPDGQGHYEDGWIYSPRHGQTFNAEMTLTNPDTLDVHGYVLTPILGESQTWTRVKTIPECTDIL